MAPSTKQRQLFMIVVCAVVLGAAVFAAASSCDGHDLTAFMEERYGRLQPDQKHWKQSVDEPLYAICASKDIEVKGEPHHMLAVCGELPDELKSHAASGYVDMYVMKREFSGLVPVAELKDVDSGSFGTPGSVTVVRLGKNFYGFKEESGWSGQGVTNSYTTIYVPAGNTFHPALRFTSFADDSGGCDGTDNCPRMTSIERSIEFVPVKKSSIYVARITSRGYANGKPVSNVYTLHYITNKHEYLVPKNFKADIGY